MRNSSVMMNIINVDAGTRRSEPARGLLRALNVCLSRGWHSARAARMRARQRQQLAALDDRLLRDIGLDRSAAQRESEKPAWRA